MKAKIWNFKSWLNLQQLNKITQGDLVTFFDVLLTESGFNVLGFIEHQFLPVGFTGLWLLAESHFAVHTFPEENKCYIELSSCNGEKHDIFIEELNKKNIWQAENMRK